MEMPPARNGLKKAGGRRERPRFSVVTLLKGNQTDPKRNTMPPSGADDSTAPLLSGASPVQVCEDQAPIAADLFPLSGLSQKHESWKRQKPPPRLTPHELPPKLTGPSLCKQRQDPLNALN